MECRLTAPPAQGAFPRSPHLPPRTPVARPPETRRVDGRRGHVGTGPRVHCQNRINPAYYPFHFVITHEIYTRTHERMLYCSAYAVYGLALQLMTSSPSYMRFSRCLLKTYWILVGKNISKP